MIELVCIKETGHAVRPGLFPLPFDLASALANGAFIRDKHVVGNSLMVTLECKDCPPN